MHEGISTDVYANWPMQLPLWLQNKQWTISYLSTGRRENMLDSDIIMCQQTKVLANLYWVLSM